MGVLALIAFVARIKIDDHSSVFPQVRWIVSHEVRICSFDGVGGGGGKAGVLTLITLVATININAGSNFPTVLLDSLSLTLVATIETNVCSIFPIVLLDSLSLSLSLSASSS